MSSNKPLSPEDITAARIRLSGGNADHKPQLAGSQVICSCGKWQSKVVDAAYGPDDARRDFEAHVNFARPVNVDQEDFEAKRKAYGLAIEQIEEMAASVFRCVRCQREWPGRDCRFHPLLPAEGILCDCGKYRFMADSRPEHCPVCERPLMVSLELSWRLECPSRNCRGELIRVKSAYSGYKKDRKFFSRLFDKRVQ